jgi:hypothetical protein
MEAAVSLAKQRCRRSHRTVSMMPATKQSTVKIQEMKQVTTEKMPNEESSIYTVRVVDELRV